MKVRQDAWSEEDDLLLAETVLRHIREGSTQLKAFDEVGDILNRTSAACGFRWNAVIRDRYEQAIELAKKQRKERKRAEQRQKKQTEGSDSPARQSTFNQQPALAVPKKSEENSPSPVQPLQEPTSPEQPTAIEQANISSLDDVIHFLYGLKDSSLQDRQILQENERLKQENEALATENDQLQKQVKRMEKEYESMQDDYAALLKIMDRARKLMLNEEEDDFSISNTAFRMDRNGNLEKISEKSS